MNNYMLQRKQIEMIIEYAKKVIQYPIGSSGHDPVDAMNLQDAIRRYEEIKATPAVTEKPCGHKHIMYINSKIGWLCTECTKFSKDKINFE